MANRADSDIESFAELTAQLDHPFADRVAVLRSAGLDEAAYRCHCDRWTADLAAAPSPALARRFGETYVRAVHALAAAPREDAAAMPDPRFLNADVQPFREEAAVVGREMVEVPSRLFIDHNPAPAPAPPTRVMMREPQPPSSVVAPFVPPSMRHFTDIRETELAAGPPPDGPVLPFRPATQAEPPEPSESASWIPEGMRSFTSIGETQPAPDAPSRPALPFATAQDRDDPDLGETPRLSLDEHARLCVELALYPAYRAAILQRYGLDEDQRQELAAFWSARITADPTLRVSWDNLCAAHRAQLLSAQHPKR
jgi:hypothetical protein